MPGSVSKQGPGPIPKQSKGVGLVKTVTPKNECVTLKGPDDCFNPCVIHGFVSLTGKEVDQQRIKVLRDTGGCQSFVLADLLPFSSELACKANVVVSGIEMGCVPAPLHYLHLKSGLVSGRLPVAILSRFPIDGVGFIMGNDLAGGKVYPAPEVVEVPITNNDDGLAQKHPNLFTLSVLTRAQACKLKSEVNLSDTLFASALSDDHLFW